MPQKLLHTEHVVTQLAIRVKVKIFTFTRVQRANRAAVNNCAIFGVTRGRIVDLIVGRGSHIAIATITDFGADLGTIRITTGRENQRRTIPTGRGGGWCSGWGLGRGNT